MNNLKVREEESKCGVWRSVRVAQAINWKKGTGYCNSCIVCGLGIIYDYIVFFCIYEIQNHITGDFPSPLSQKPSDALRKASE